MKKIIFLIICCMFLITGCNNSNTDSLSKFVEESIKHDSYNLKGEMKIISDEDEFIYDLNVIVKNKKYYRVELKNMVNNHLQVILKNDDGVYVVTPSQNKSFKFSSNWPNNSSQAYLIESLINDINTTEDTTIKKSKENYIISTKVNYPNNPTLVYEDIEIKDNEVKRVSVKDENKKEIIVIMVKDINYKPTIKTDTFSLTSLITEQKEEKTMSTIDEIIYPLYVPSDTYLSSKDTVSTDEGNRVILTFSGVDPFILVEESSSVFKEMEIIPVNGEPLQLSSTVGALTDNSLYFTSNGIDYFLTSNTLSKNELMTIAESITNSKRLVASTK